MILKNKTNLVLFAVDNPSLLAFQGIRGIFLQIKYALKRLSAAIYIER